MNIDQRTDNSREEKNGFGLESKQGSTEYLGKMVQVPISG